MARYQGKQGFQPSDTPTQPTFGDGCGGCCLLSSLLFDLENDSNESLGGPSPLPSWFGWLPCCCFYDVPSSTYCVDFFGAFHHIFLTSHPY
jgi:hypothetical protein